MVYIARDGRLHQGPRPWGVERLKETFWSFISTIELFFTTLLNIESSNRSVTYRSSNGNGSSGRRGGGSNQSGPRFRTMSDIRPPPPAFGGCAGGSCGR